MRISFVTATPQSVAEGSGTYVAGMSLLDGLEELGHRVRVISPRRPPGILGYTVHRFRFNAALRPSHFRDADLAVGFDMDGYRVAGRTDCSFVTYIHGQLADEARFERGLVAASMRLQARAEAAAVRRADRVVTVSRYSRRRIAELYGLPDEQIAVVPNAFDAAGWRDTQEGAAHRPDARPTVLCVARMYPRKNIAALVRATAALRRRVPDVLVRIVGDGPERRRLARLVHELDLADHVLLAGHLEAEALAGAYAACDVFCLPSLQEGFGLVVLEAMAAGRPVVACGGTAVDELIENGVNGFLVQPHDEAGLAETLGRLLGDAALQRAMSDANRGRLERFAPATIARQFLAAAGLGNEAEETE
jgi:glycosyltransferase involved in cell wall biosynthesis